MSKFLRLILSVVALVGMVSAFTVVPATKSFHASTLPQVAPSSTSLNAIIVDPAIADMVSKSSPVGALMLGVFFVSLWELITPGRAKKE